MQTPGKTRDTCCPSNPSRCRVQGPEAPPHSLMEEWNLEAVGLIRAYTALLAHLEANGNRPTPEAQRLWSEIQGFVEARRARMGPVLGRDPAAAEAAEEQWTARVLARSGAAQPASDGGKPETATRPDGFPVGAGPPEC